MSELKETCPTFSYFGAKYPDATCIDGQLYDLDKCDDEGNLYELDEYHPCPFCNREAFIEKQIENEYDRDKVLKYLENLDKHKHKGHILFREL